MTRLLKRLVATPMSRAAYLLSFILSRLTMLVFEAALLLGFGSLVFGVPMRGSLLALGVICLLGALAFGGLGLLVAARPRTIEGASGLMNLAMVPMWVGSGVFFSSARFPEVVQPFVQALPLTAVNDATSAALCMQRGALDYLIKPIDLSHLSRAVQGALRRRDTLLEGQQINQWLKVEERARSIELGRELFEREAKKYRLNPAALLAGEDMARAASDLGYPTPDDVLAAVGYGKASVHQLLNKIAPGATLDTVERPKASAGTRPKTEQGVRIRGVDDLLVRFAKCCNPLPGDQIVGFITRGRGLTVHARDCLTVVKSVLDRERLVNVEWDIDEPAHETAKRPVRIAVYIERDRPGLLSEITGAISSRNGNITKAEVEVTDDRRGINNFVVEVADLRQLQEIMSTIREVPDVINVERVRGL